MDLKSPDHLQLEACQQKLRLSVYLLTRLKLSENKISINYCHMLGRSLTHIDVGQESKEHMLTSRQQQALAGHSCSGQQPLGSHLWYKLGQATAVDMMNTVCSLHWPAHKIYKLLTNCKQHIFPLYHNLNPTYPIIHILLLLKFNLQKPQKCRSYTAKSTCHLKRYLL
jgi:hypothetical protein